MTLDPTGRLFVERLTVKAWGGEDTISISGDDIAPNGDSVSNMTLNLGAGINTVSLNSLQSFGPLKMTTGDGNDELNLTDVELHVKNSDKLAPMTVQAGRVPDRHIDRLQDRSRHRGRERRGTDRVRLEQREREHERPGTEECHLQEHWDDDD